jgi:AcrR family transcriptional regulator
MSSPGLRERKKQKTRWLIQEHAVRLFREQGYEQTTVDQIAAAAEISPSTFFRYFKTKEDVVLEDEYDGLILGLVAAAPADLPPVAALRQAMRGAFATMAPEELTRLFERTKLMLSVPALRMRMMDSMTDQLGIVGGALAIRTKRSPDDFAARVLAGAFFGAVLAAVTVWVEGGESADFPGLIDQALAQFEGMPI